MLGLGPFGADGELEFVGRLIVHRCELAIPIAAMLVPAAWAFSSGCWRGRSVCRRRKSWRRRGKLRGCGRNRCCHGENEHNGAAEECPGHDLLLRLPATKSMWAKLVEQSDKDGWPGPARAAQGPGIGRRTVRAPQCAPK